MQQTALFNELNDRNKTFIEKVKYNIIDATLNELGKHTIENC